MNNRKGTKYTFKHPHHKKVRDEHNATPVVNRKKVKCLNNGVTYDSVKECGERLSIKSVNYIGRVALGRQDNYKGFKFEYV